jgi:hypothetical protein
MDREGPPSEVPPGTGIARAAEPADRAARPQVRIRVVLLVAAYVVWGGVAALLCAVHGSSETSVGSGAPEPTTGLTIYQVNPGPVTVILLGTFVALVVATASVVWRVRHHSPKVGVAAVVAACAVGAVALLGALTVGPFLVPLAVLLVVAALPMDTLGVRDSHTKGLDPVPPIH